MTFTFSEDYGLIRIILTDARCFRRMRNDTAPPIERFSVGPTPGVRFVIADEGGCVSGVFLLVEQGMGGAEVHFCIQPEWWGESRRIGAAFLEWVWASTSLTRLSGPVPDYNRLAQALAHAVGFKKILVTEPRIRKGGKMYAIVQMEIARPNAANLTAGA